MKTYVFTGASSGIGAATKRIVEEQGIQVINIDLRNCDIVADLSSDAGRQAAIDAVIERCPDGIDGLVCFAGVSGDCGKPALMASLNYYGAVAIAEGLFESLQKKNGSCVLLASDSIAEGYAIQKFVQLMLTPGSEPKLLGALGGMDGETVLRMGNAMYITSKYAIALWVRRHAAMWGARGVHLNCVAPGTVNTPMVSNMSERAMWALNSLQVPVKYGKFLMLEPEEVANVIAFLLSPLASGIHGTTLFIDGGTEAAINTEHVY